MSYVRIPSGNISRNENQLRSIIDTLHNARVNLQAMSAKIAAMKLDGGDQRVADEFNITEPEAVQLDLILTSASVEQRDSTPFTVQLITNFS